LVTGRDWDYLDMPEPTAFLPVLRSSTDDLVTGLSGLAWSASDVASPSLCDGWTRGHVLTHIARNASGIADTIAGALRGEIVERYPGGWDARNAAISSGASRPFSALVADVRDSASRLASVLDDVAAADAWDVPTAEDQTPEVWVYWRLREVVVHRVDLAADYSPSQWPAVFVARELGEAALSLAQRVGDQAVRVTVTADGSLVSDYVGKSWSAGSGEPVEVSGPDWAVLAWLTGRASVVASALTATPPLGDWR
jgi:maleylpyruvate isomerase